MISAGSRATAASAWLLVRLFALQRIAAYPWQSALPALSIGIGVALLFGVLVLNSSITASFSAFSKTLDGDAVLEVVGKGANGIPAAVLDRVRATEGVKTAAPILDMPALLELKERSMRVMVVGADASLATLAGPRGVGGAWVDAAGAGALQAGLVSTEVGTALGGGSNAVLRLHAGDRSLRLRVGGVLEGRADTAGSGGRFIFIPLDTAQWLFRKPGRLGSILVVPTEATKGPDASARLAQRLVQVVGPGVLALPVGQRVNELRQAAASVQSFAVFASLLALVVGSYLIFNSIAMSMRHERREMGILLAIGDTRMRIVLRVLVFAAVLGVAGTAGGLIAGWHLGSALVDALPRMTQGIFAGDIHAAASAWAALLAAGMGILASVAGASLPALSVLRLQPVEAVRLHPAGPVAIGSSRVTTAVAIVGGLTVVSVLIAGRWTGRFELAHLALALLGALCATPALIRLALRGASSALAVPVARAGTGVCQIISAGMQENPTRNMATIIAAALSIGTVVAIGGATIDVENSVRPFAQGLAAIDLYVASEDDPYLSVALGPHAIRAVAATDGVGQVRESMAAFVRLNGSKVWLRGDDPAAYESWGFVLHGADRRTVAGGLKAGGILVSTQIAHREHLRIGDAVSLETAEGPRSFPVLATFESWSWPEGTLVIDSALFRARFEPTGPSQLVVQVAPGVSVDSVTGSIRRIAGLDATRGTELRDRVLADLRAQLAPFRLIRSAAMLMIVVMVLNTAMLALMQRRREIGVLRAIGMSRRQLASSIVLEALLLILLAAAVGFALGTLFQGLGIVFIESATGLPLQWSLQGRAFVEGLAAAVLGALAGSVYPAWLAAKLSIVDAIAYE